MERIRSLSRFQKVFLAASVAMILIFGAIYAVAISRVGYEYYGEILVPREENGSTVYEGEADRETVVFTVRPDKTVEFRYGDRPAEYYTLREDPGALSEEYADRTDVRGIAVYCGDDAFFRGMIIDRGDGFLLLNEDGEAFGMSYSAYTENMGELSYDENGRLLHPMRPTAATIIELINGSELTHKGEWRMFIVGAICCVLNALSIVFADEFFRFFMALRIRNAAAAEPSGLELLGRHFSWAALALVAFAVFAIGLS